MRSWLLPHQFLCFDGFGARLFGQLPSILVFRPLEGFLRLRQHGACVLHLLRRLLIAACASRGLNGLTRIAHCLIRRDRTSTELQST